MCLAVIKDFQIKTVESPIIVYKEARYDESDKIATSKYQGFEYKRGEIVTCKNPFLTQDRDDISSFFVYDAIESVTVNEYFRLGTVDVITHLRELWFTGSFELIKTGFHFCFGDKNQLRNISHMCEFLIPAGARIITGIDNTLGVTDQIMLL